MISRIKNVFKKIRAYCSAVIDTCKDWVHNFRDKLSNLYETNYNTGMYHLAQKHIWDATFRFKIIRKFWPDKLDAQYQYAFCLVLGGMDENAIVVLKDLLTKDPSYTKAKTLLDHISLFGGKDVVDNFMGVSHNEEEEVENEKNTSKDK